MTTHAESATPARISLALVAALGVAGGALAAPAKAPRGSASPAASTPAGPAEAGAALTVRGDWVVAGERHEIPEGHRVTGDVVALGADLHVRGEVHGDAVAVGGNVFLHRGARVGGDVVAVGGRVRRDEGVSVGRGVQSVGIPGIGMVMRGLADAGVLRFNVKGEQGEVSVGEGEAGAGGVPEADWEAEGKDMRVPPGETVHGDVKVSRGNVVVDGVVTGDVRVFHGSVTVNGRVEDDVRVIAGGARVAQGAEIGGDLTAFRGDVDIQGRVCGKVRAAGGKVTLGSKSAVFGSIRVVGAGVERAPGAVVLGSIREMKGGPLRTFLEARGFDGAGGVFPWNVLGRVGAMAGWLAVSLLVGLLLARPVAGAAVFVARRTALSAGMGVAGWFLALVACLALLVTCVGILLIPVVALAFALTLSLGVFTGAFWLGDGLLRIGRNGGPARPYTALLLGTFLVTLVGFLPVLGPAIKWIGIGTLGLGALLASRFGRRTPDGPGALVAERTGEGPAAA